MEIVLRKIEADEYNLIKPKILAEYQKNAEEENLERKKNFVHFHTFYSEQLQGIFLDGILVGLFELSKMFGNISISIYILPEFRGHGISGLVQKKIVEEYGKYYPESSRFLCEVDPRNTSSLRRCGSRCPL